MTQFFAFLLILLFTVVPKCSIYALSHVPKRKEGCDVPYGEKTYVLAKLCSGVRTVLLVMSSMLRNQLYIK